jgi:murein DD-endopeptidase MepM/ murein hydrolase activator NlpD
MVILFNKMLDPGSVVREGEFARTAEGQALLDQLTESVKKLEEGGAGVTPEVINQMASTAKKLFGSAQEGIQSTVDLFASEAEAVGLDAGRVISSTSSSAIDFLEPLTQSFSSLEELVTARPEYEVLIEELDTALPTASDEEILRLIEESQGLSSSGQGAFREDLSTSVNGSTGSVLGLGEVTGFGSPLWEHGLDIDLAIGDAVPSPVSGKVVFAGFNESGFGNQVKIKTSQGNTVWLSHLDGIDVSVGDTISSGQVVGAGGNSGNTIPGANGDGSHLDLTVQKSDGSFFTPEDIFSQLNKFA